jgi:hypothetical protein
MNLYFLSLLKPEIVDERKKIKVQIQEGMNNLSKVDKDSHFVMVTDQILPECVFPFPFSLSWDLYQKLQNSLRYNDGFREGKIKIEKNKYLFIIEDHYYPFLSSYSTYKVELNLGGRILEFVSF